MCDKQLLRNLGTDKNIDDIINHYEKIFQFYNNMAGISFEPNQITDNNIPDKYFIKADKNGVGCADYTDTHTAETSNSVANFWLNIDDSNWGSLHEIAHGYQGFFMDNQSCSTGEVWNNIYAATYQDTYLGRGVFTEGGLYG